MALELIPFDELMSYCSIRTHFYLDSRTNNITYILDDLQLKECIEKDFTVLHQLKSSSLEGNPFKTPDESKHRLKQLIVYNDVAYEIKTAKNEETGLTHYVLFPLDIKAIDNDENFEQLKNSLTERETEILTLISDGLSMSKIAKILLISPHTVDSHRIKLCKKLNVRRTTQLAIWAYKFGLLSDLQKSSRPA